MLLVHINSCSLVVKVEHIVKHALGKVYIMCYLTYTMQQHWHFCLQGIWVPILMQLNHHSDVEVAWSLSFAEYILMYSCLITGLALVHSFGICQNKGLSGGVHKYLESNFWFLVCGGQIVLAVILVLDGTMLPTNWLYMDRIDIYCHVIHIIFIVTMEIDHIS